MEFSCHSELVPQAGAEFDAVVAKIEARDFLVGKPPECKTCKECDLRSYRVAEGTTT